MNKLWERKSIKINEIIFLKVNLSSWTEWTTLFWEKCGNWVAQLCWLWDYWPQAWGCHQNKWDLGAPVGPSHWTRAAALICWYTCNSGRARMLVGRQLENEQRALHWRLNWGKATTCPLWRRETPTAWLMPPSIHLCAQSNSNIQ